MEEAWTQDTIDFQGEFYDIRLETTDRVRPYLHNGGRCSTSAATATPQDLCADHCDVYLVAG